MNNQHIYDSIIIGAGFGGLGQGAQFVQDGIDNFLILEKEDTLGGVWRDNNYPGAACDTQAVIYCYSYHLHLDVSRMYAGRDELLRYLTSLADKFGLHQHLRTNSLVTETTWDEDSKLWEITTATGEIYLSRSWVPAWGQLGIPNIPDLPGLEAFEGETFHSVEWRHDLELRGKKVASIGAAATAVQYVPEVAKVASQLSVFQRSANYIMPRSQQIFSDEQITEFQQNPDTYRKVRKAIHQEREAGFERTRKQTDAAAEGMRLAREHMESVITDPKLREQFTPDYDFGCKRILRSDDFYPTFNHENVSLVTEGIQRVTPKGIVTADGVEHEVDIIIFGTGFKSHAFQGDMQVIGREGRDLSDRWGNAPEAFLGMCVDGYPNMFIIYGPNTNLNHHSIVAMIEAQNRYVSQAVALLKEDAELVLDVTPDTLNEFNAHVQEELDNSAFSADCSSWYKNADGKVINNWSGTVKEYHDLTRALDLVDYGIAAPVKV
ncbi:4-hydroxyacetophenone monooxygenase [Corynebacterium occultum]|uniref:4-hydroxyacetophenone monooxygenase n=1 Tax=Corynebacterium occultum TaxID=2675219 RepID=A0A6B8WAC5_9CORY|nr:NAD(P)/FAD-dependent oxidoreductase [Corynebacterium occultum]QGU08235.1 4-hydroxyacetophenone monooxygenase [Corynebacterium occultum]